MRRRSCPRRALLLLLLLLQGQKRATVARPTARSGGLSALVQCRERAAFAIDPEIEPMQRQSCRRSVREWVSICLCPSSPLRRSTTAMRSYTIVVRTAHLVRLVRLVLPLPNSAKAQHGRCPPSAQLTWTGRSPPILSTSRDPRASFLRRPHVFVGPPTRARPQFYGGPWENCRGSV